MDERIKNGKMYNLRRLIGLKENGDIAFHLQIRKINAPQADALTVNIV